MAPHSSTLAWKIPWTEEPGRLQSMGSLRVGHDWAISLSLFTFMHWRRKWQLTPVFLPGESQGRGSLVRCRLWGHTESDTTERIHFHFPLSCIGEGNGNPFQCSCLENPRDGRAWWAAVYGVTQSQTQLKRLSNSSSSSYNLEKAMAPHSSTLAWKIPWAEEPGRLQSMRSLRVRHYWAISLSLFTFMHWRRKWQPTPVFLPGESQGWGSLVGCCLWGRTESDTTELT